MYRLRPGLELVLASASPRRQEMLSRLGLRYRTRPAEVDESLLPGEKAAGAVKRLARLKAQAVAARRPQALVLAADTLVCLGDSILGKPLGQDDAAAMLGQLSGQTHDVLTGYCLIAPGSRDLGLARSKVRFRQVSDSEIAAYVLSGEPLGKAGAYAVQGLAAAWVHSVSGSYTNVVGLPLAQIIALLLKRGFIEPFAQEAS